MRIAKHSPKVTELDRSTFPNQDILWLHVTVKNSMRVEIKESRDQLAGHTPHHTHIQTLVILQNLK